MRRHARTLGAAITFVVASSTIAAATAQPLVDTFWIARGASVFKRACAGCHGAGGAAGLAPKLKGTKLADAKIRKIVAEGKPPKMPAFGKKLRPGELKAVGLYVGNLRAKK
jgi:mono/diheme cytochrome c family protein